MPGRAMVLVVEDEQAIADAVAARLRTILRRAERSASGSPEESVTVGDVDLDAQRRLVTCRGEPVHLTPTEFDLLWSLANVGAVRTRQQLLLEVWGYRDGSGARTVDSSLVLVQVLSRGMTSPLREMASAAEAMARGDRAQPITATSRDEVGQLARAFNAMTSQLSEVDRQRRDLVANVSHELRTPIGALQAMLENLVDGVEAPDEEALRTMLRQVERLSRLVQQLLDLSRLEAGSIPLHREPFAIIELLEDVTSEASVHTPQVPVLVDADPSLLVDGDRERIHQVIANLVENAARYSPPGAKIDVVARQQGGAVIIEVLDNGPGIPEAETERVFERFYRADQARSSAGGGAGLGLAIARWIVDLHGGEIHAEPREPTGCRVVVTLPRSTT